MSINACIFYATKLSILNYEIDRGMKPFPSAGEKLLITLVPLPPAWHHTLPWGTPPIISWGEAAHYPGPSPPSMAPYPAPGTPPIISRGEATPYPSPSPPSMAPYPAPGNPSHHQPGRSCSLP